MVVGICKTPVRSSSVERFLTKQALINVGERQHLYGCLTAINNIISATHLYFHNILFLIHNC